MAKDFGLSNMNVGTFKVAEHNEIMAKRVKVVKPGDAAFEELAALYSSPGEGKKKNGLHVQK